MEQTNRAAEVPLSKEFDGDDAAGEPFLVIVGQAETESKRENTRSDNYTQTVSPAASFTSRFLFLGCIRNKKTNEQNFWKKTEREIERERKTKKKASLQNGQICC